MRRDNKDRNVLYRYTRPQTACAEARLGQTARACLWAPTRGPQHSMSVHILIVSDRSLQNSTSRRYSSTMFSSCWSAAQSRVSRRRRRRPGACAAHGEVSSLCAFAWAAWRRRRWESAPSIRAQLLIYYTKLLLRGQRSRLSSPQPAGKLGLQAAQALLRKGCRRCRRRRHSCRAELCRTSSAMATEA